MKNRGDILSKVDTLALRRIKIRKDSGEEIRFAELWKKSGKTLVVLLRHFGCISCRAHVKKITDNRQGHVLKGVKVVFVGNGSPWALRAFRKEMGLGPEIDIYTDPSLESHRACGMKRSAACVFNPRSVSESFRMVAQGIKVGMPAPGKGDVFQMGGWVLFNRSGAPVHHHASHYMGDFGDEMIA